MGIHQIREIPARRDLNCFSWSRTKPGFEAPAPTSDGPGSHLGGQNVVHDLYRARIRARTPDVLEEKGSAGRTNPDRVGFQGPVGLV